MATYAPSKRKLYTLVMPLDVGNRRILLGQKKRGFGVGKYNGFGGKVEPKETILEGVIRELEEESCIKATETHYHGVLFLEAISDPSSPILEIHVFAATKWDGEPAETEEMRPEWYPAAPNFSDVVAADEIPYKQMWEETGYWLALLLDAYFGPTGTVEKGKEVQFLHNVTFGKGVNPETGEEDDVWHGMLDNYFLWLGVGEEGLPRRLEEWGEEEKEKWVEGRRMKRFGI